MAESILARLTNTKDGKEVFKNLSEMNSNIKLMYALQQESAKKQEKWEKDKEKTRRREEQDAKRKQGDVPVLGTLFGKKAKDDPDKKGNPLLDLIKGFAGSLTGIVKSILSGPFLQKLLIPAAKMLFTKGGPIFGVITAALAGWKIGEWLNKNVIDTHIKPKAQEFDNGVRKITDQITGGGAFKGTTSVKASELIQSKKELLIGNPMMGVAPLEGGAREETEKDIETLTQLIFGIRERQKINNSLYDAKKEQNKDKIDKLAKELKDKEDKLLELVQSRPALSQELDIQKKQRGGHINVPGSGSGDKVPMMLPPNSFVMNRNASAMLQSGGLVPTLLEPGEKVFGPGQWGPMEHMMNTMIPRFQEGGKVPSATGEGRTVSPKSGSKSSSANHAYLEKMNDKNIKKASAPPGYCVTGSLNTMQKSGVPNPAATGADAGNNPRGAIVQLIKSFGWQSIGGNSTTLKSPYGTVNTGIFGKSEYAKAVDSGQIPSGALIFQTQHSDWNGTSDRSRGYDMAVAQKKGRELWNGQPNGQWIYGNTNKVVALTPGGKPGDGSAPGASGGGSSGGGDGGRGPSGIIGQLSGMGQIGSALKGLIDVYKGALGENSWLMDMITGGGESSNITPPEGENGGSSGGVSGDSPALSGDMAKKAKEMVMYARSKGLSDAHAKGLIANAMRESSLNPAHDKPHGAGLFQWTDTGGRRGRMKAAVPNFATNWKGQIDYAMTEDYGPKWKASKFSSPADAAKSFLTNWERSANQTLDQQKNLKFLESMKGYQTGGVVNLSRSGQSSGNFKQAQKEFADQIAQASGSNNIIVVPSGGNSSPVGAPDVSPNQMAPSLPSGPSSAQAIDYLHRFALGVALG